MTPGEYMTDSALRAYLVLLRRGNDMYNYNFHIETDTLQLQQIGEQRRLKLNSGTLLHVGGNHFVAVACKDPKKLDYCDSLNPSTVSDATKTNLSRMKPQTASRAAIKPVSNQIEVECGGYGLAFLTLYFFGFDPSDWVIKSQSVRTHTTSSLLHLRISPYPAKRIDRAARETTIPI